jgi:superfamily I DNA/RNA helicase
MHRVKGLEFDRVVVAGVNDGIVPLAEAVKATDDDAVRADVERQERALLYVSLTRARREALITSFGSPSQWTQAK